MFTLHQILVTAINLVVKILRYFHSTILDRRRLGRKGLANCILYLGITLLVVESWFVVNYSHSDAGTSLQWHSFVII